MDWKGIFLLSSSSGMRNPDRYFINSFALYDPGQRVEQSANVHFHDAHKKKSVHDIAQFDHEYHASDLLHKKDIVGGGRNQVQDFDEENLV